MGTGTSEKEGGPLGFWAGEKMVIVQIEGKRDLASMGL